LGILLLNIHVDIPCLKRSTMSSPPWPRCYR